MEQSHTFGSLLHIRELCVMILRNLIILTIVSGSFGTNITIPSTTTLPSTNQFQLDNTEPQPTKFKEIIEFITETIEYTELPEGNTEAAEIFNEPMRTTSQLRGIDVVSKTKISGIPTTLITNGVTTTQATVSTMSTTTETPSSRSSQRPSTTPTVLHTTNSALLTTLAENSSSSKQTTSIFNYTSKAATSSSSTSSKQTAGFLAVAPDATTSMPTTSGVSSQAATSSLELTTNNVTPSITNGSTTASIASTEQTSPISISRVPTVIPTQNISTISRVTTPIPTWNSSTISIEPSSSKQTTLPIPEVETNATLSTLKQTTQREHLSSSASPQISTSTNSTNIYFPNSTTSIPERTSISSTNRSTTAHGRASTTLSSTDEFLTTTIYENGTSTIKYVDGDPPDDRDDLPILLIVIASTVALLVTLLLLCFVLILCVAKKRQQRKNAKYYDYKKRWVKKAPRPKYEKVKQHLKHDQEAAGAGWVFRDGADPSKQITLELRPRNSQSPEDFADSSKARNYDGPLSDSFPTDLLSVSQEGGLDLDLNFGSLGSLRLSKGIDRGDRSIRSNSSEGDSGILALGEDAWSPTKGVPFHFISDDAVIEL